MNLLNEPLTPPEAKRIILRALASGDVRFTTHALTEMAKDGITQLEALGILRSGVVEPGELVKATWRYRVRVRQAIVVTAFRAECSAVVVTAWRIR
jgi:hypothetical protein